MAFIGTIEEYEEYQKTEKPSDIIEGNGNKISYDDLPELSEEDARIIRQTRLHHVPYDVYMQSDATFYDEHYNKSTELNGVDEEFMNEVKSIRRIYKNYPQWCRAMNLRDQYIDKLIDQYGGEDMFLVYLQSGLVGEWIPPRPIYSTNSPDYQAYLEGKLVNINDWDDAALIENIAIMLEEFEKEHGISVNDVGVIGSVLTNPLDLKNSGVTEKKSMYRVGGMNNSFDGVSTNNVDELQKMIQSWISPETVKSEKVSVEGMFSSTEDAIKHEYYTRPFVSAGGLARAMNTGEIDEMEVDLNEMIVDEVTGRPMTRRELTKRQLVRFLSEYAGWDELRMMKHLRVGSNFELKLMEQRDRTHRTAKKKARSFVNDICGEDISTIDELSNALFDD